MAATSASNSKENELSTLSSKLEKFLLTTSVLGSGDAHEVEDVLGEGLGRSTFSMNDVMLQRWVVYLSTAVHLRYHRRNWLNSGSGLLSTSNRHVWKNVADQADLAVLNFCESYNQLLSSGDAAIWADSFSNLLRYEVPRNITNQLEQFREAGFDAKALDGISCELLNAIDQWLSKIPETYMSEETIAHLTTLCSEILRYPNSGKYFLKSTQLTDGDDIFDGLSSAGGLEFLFTSAYQLFPLYPLPITKLFSSCASVSKESAATVRNVLSKMACFLVQIPSAFPVTSVMQLSHPNDCVNVTVLQPWKPPGELHLVIPTGTKGMVLSHWPENGAIQRILFTHHYNAFEWFAALTSSVASDAVQIDDDGSILDLLFEVAQLFCGLAKNLDTSLWYDTNFAILGPFSRLAPCLNATRESNQLVRHVVALLATVIKYFAIMAVRCPEEIAVIFDEYWAPVLLNGFYGELLSTYECRFADFQVTSAICFLMSSFLETKYFEWMYSETLKKNLVSFLDSFLHTALANVATWRFSYLKKRVDHLRNIYALAALIFDVYSVAARRSPFKFNNVFITDPLLGHIANSLPSKVVEFVMSIADFSLASSVNCQQLLVQPSVQSLVSAFLSCLLRMYRMVNNSTTDKWDIISPIAVGSADLVRSIAVLTSLSTPTFSLSQNNRRLCFELVSVILSVLGHSLSLNGLLSFSDRKQFQTVIVDTISEEEKYVTSEAPGNARLLLIQATMELVEATMQFQPAFFADLSSRIKPLIMSILWRPELHQSLPSLYHASLRIVAAAWRHGRHQHFAKQLVEDNKHQEFWSTVIHPLEVDISKDTTHRKSQLLSALTALEIVSLELFNFCQPGSTGTLNATLASKLSGLFENGFINARIESIFDFLLLSEDDGDFFPTSQICTSAGSCLQTFAETMATVTLPRQILKARQQLELIDSFVSVSVDLLTDLRQASDLNSLIRTSALSHSLLPSLLRAILVMVHQWSKTAFTSSRVRVVPKGAALGSSATGIFAKCIEVCRMVLSAPVVGDELPLRFDEPGPLSLMLVVECLGCLKDDASLAVDCRDVFPKLTADVITQLVATESDDRVPTEFFSSALAVINSLILTHQDVTDVLVQNEIFICKLVECTARAFHDNTLTEINVDSLAFLLNVINLLNKVTGYSKHKGQEAFAVRRVFSSLSNAFYSHVFLECALNGSQPCGTTSIQRTAAGGVIDMLTAMTMHSDGDKNFVLPTDTICTFLAVYTSRFAKLAQQLTPASDLLHFSVCFSWMRLIERITSRLSLDQAHSQSSELNLTDIVTAFFMNSFILLYNCHNSPTTNSPSETQILRLCSCAVTALLKINPNLSHIIHGEIFQGGRQISAVVEADFSLVSLGISSPKPAMVRSRTPQCLTFGFLFACFQTTLRRIRRPSDGGHELANKLHPTIDMAIVASVLHSIVQLIVSQAVLHLQLIQSSLMSTGPAYQQSQQAVAATMAAFNDQLKPELSTCLGRFRRFLSSLPSATLPQGDAEDFQELCSVYEQIVCN